MQDYEKIKNIMRQKGIKQIDLVNTLEVPRSNVSSWLSGSRGIPKDKIIEIAKLLNVSADYLLGSDEIPLKTIPLIGLASCGVPNIAYNDIIEHIPVPADLARDGVYAVRADGDSMLPKINNGDIVICDKEMSCENGNIVHYTTINGDSGLKKYLIDKKGVVTLMPLNSDFTPIMCDVKDLRCARAFKIVADL